MKLSYNCKMESIDVYILLYVYYVEKSSLNAYILGKKKDNYDNSDSADCKMESIVVHILLLFMCSKIITKTHTC